MSKSEGIVIRFVSTASLLVIGCSLNADT